MTVDNYPVLKLNESSRSVIKGEEKILPRRERIEVKDKKKSKEIRKTDFDFNQTLYDLLSLKRKEIATEKKMPPYVIFHNTVLEELAYSMPTTKEKLLKIKGIGEKKFDNYGEAFINVIEDFKGKELIFY